MSEIHQATQVVSRGSSRLKFVAVLVLSTSGVAGCADRSTDAPPARSGGSTAPPLRFEINRGQVPGPARFVARAPGATLHLTPQRMVLATGTAAITMRLAGARRAAIVADAPAADRVTSLVGPRSRWRQGVPTYPRVRYRRPWPGIDVVVRTQRGDLEYDMVVSPGADPGRARLTVSGARPRLDADGDLLLIQGTTRVRQHRPVTYQRIGGRRVAVQSRFVLRGNEVRFAVGRYDHSRTLVIDPGIAYDVQFAGTHAGNLSAGVAQAPDGSTYLAATMHAADFPTSGAYEGDDGGADAVVVKLAANGQALWSTYLGGSGEDTVRAVAADAGGVYLGGETHSADFPVTPGAADSSLSGGSDGFVTKLPAAGASLAYSTLIGGENGESVGGLAVDAAGRAHAAGSTFSADFPAHGPSPGAYAGSGDAFVAQFSATGGAGAYAGYLGGGQADSAAAAALTSTGELIVAGETGSGGLGNPPPASPLQGAVDAFVTSVDPSGATGALTYVGGTGSDWGTSLALSSTGAVFVGGTTMSPTFPVATGRLDDTRDGSSDGFVARVLLGVGPDRATLLGGDADDAVLALAADDSGRVTAAGTTSDSALVSDLPGNPFDAPTEGYAIRLNEAMTARELTVLAGGGTQANFVTGVALDAFGDPVVAGTAQSGGVGSIFALRADSRPPMSSITDGPTGETAALRPSFAFSADESGATFACRFDGGAFSACSAATSHAPDADLAPGAHTFEVRATDVAGNVEATPSARGFSVAAPPVTTEPEPPATLPAATTPGPQAALASQDHLHQGERFALDAGASTGDGLRYAFDLNGDGTYEIDNAGAPSLIVGMIGEGARVVGVRVTDAQGRVSTAQATLRTSPVLLTGAAQSRSAAKPRQSITIRGNPTVAQDAPVRYWSFDPGDGSRGTTGRAGGITFSASRGVRVNSSGIFTHRYAKAGTYSWTLRAVGADGQQALSFGTVVVNRSGRHAAGTSTRQVPTAATNLSPIATAIPDPVTGVFNIDEPVQFRYDDPGVKGTVKIVIGPEGPVEVSLLDIASQPAPEVFSDAQLKAMGLRRVRGAHSLFTPRQVQSSTTTKDVRSQWAWGDKTDPSALITGAPYSTSHHYKKAGTYTFCVDWRRLEAPLGTGFVKGSVDVKQTIKGPVDLGPFKKGVVLDNPDVGFIEIVKGKQYFTTAGAGVKVAGLHIKPIGGRLELLTSGTGVGLLRATDGTAEVTLAETEQVLAHVSTLTFGTFTDPVTGKKLDKVPVPELNLSFTPKSDVFGNKLGTPLSPVTGGLDAVGLSVSVRPSGFPEAFVTARLPEQFEGATVFRILGSGGGQPQLRTTGGDGFKLEVPDANFGPVSITDITLEKVASEARISGGANVDILGLIDFHAPSHYGFPVSGFHIVNGKFDSAGARSHGPYALGILRVSDLSAQFQTDPFYFEGSATLGMTGVPFLEIDACLHLRKLEAGDWYRYCEGIPVNALGEDPSVLTPGPKLNAYCKKIGPKACNVNAPFGPHASLSATDQFLVGARGKARVFGFEIASGYFTYLSGAQTFSFGGKLDVSLPLVSVKAFVNGFAGLTDGRFQIHAGAELSIADTLSVGGQILVNNNWLAGCITFIGTMGAAINLDGHGVDVFFGCNIKKKYGLKNTRALRQAGRTSVATPKLPGGLPGATLMIQGPPVTSMSANPLASAAPVVKVTAPNGRQVMVDDGTDMQEQSAYKILRMPATRTTAFHLIKPAAGTYRVETLDGSPIHDVQVLEEAKPLEVHAVAGAQTGEASNGFTHRKRSLDVDIAAGNGETVTLHEEAIPAPGQVDQQTVLEDGKSIVDQPAAEMGHRIASFKASKQSRTVHTTFRPDSSTPDTKRRLVAFVERNGVPVRRIVVDPSFTVPKLTKPAPQNVTLTPVGSGARASWKAVPGATAYKVVVTASDGRAHAFRVGAKTLELMLPRWSRGQSGKVTVSALAKTGVSGKATASKSLPKLAIKMAAVDPGQIAPAKTCPTS